MTAKNKNFHQLDPTSLEYPSSLLRIMRPPWLLYARGRLELLQRPMVSIEGSRECTKGGAKAARAYARALVDAGLCVCSGMAKGIDAEVHRAALAAGGKTVAVLGTGIDEIHPSEHAELAEAIAEKGVLVTEYSRGAPARRETLSWRNRLIVGLGQVLLVIEAAEHSGTMAAAKEARSQGRRIYARRGSPGGDQLIAGGAVEVTSPDELLMDLVRQDRGAQREYDRYIVWAFDLSADEEALRYGRQAWAAVAATDEIAEAESLAATIVTAGGRAEVQDTFRGRARA